MAEQDLPGWMGSFVEAVMFAPQGTTPYSKTGYWKWNCHHDGRTRNEHLHSEGEVRPIGKRFSNGQRHPRDQTAEDPSKWINCRCWLTEAEPE